MLENCIRFKLIIYGRSRTKGCFKHGEPFAKQALDSLNPGPLEPFLPTSWKKNPFY